MVVTSTSNEVRKGNGTLCARRVRLMRIAIVWITCIRLFFLVLNGENEETHSNGTSSNKTLSSSKGLSHTNATISSAVSTAATPPSSNTEPRPRLVMIVGPGKCGSTSFQEVLEKLKANLSNDNFVCEGRFDGPGIDEAMMMMPLLKSLTDSNCKKQTQAARKSNATVPSCWKQVTDELDRSYAQGSNVLIIEEWLSFVRFDIQSFLAAVSKWKVEAVAIYRPLFSWLPSTKNQHEKGLNARYMFPTKPLNETGSAFWSSDRHRPMPAPPFFTAMSSPVNRAKVGFRYFDTVYNSYQDILKTHPAASLSVLRMETGMIEHFFCNILAAKEACQALKMLPPKRANPSVSMEYDLIATAAIDRGILKLTENNITVRKEVTDALRQFHKDTKNFEHLPLECTDSDALDALLTESLRIERELVPQFYDEQEHRNEFNKEVNKKKYCSVNTSAILEDPAWRDFLAKAPFLK